MNTYFCLPNSNVSCLYHIIYVGFTIRGEAKAIVKRLTLTLNLDRVVRNEAHTHQHAHYTRMCVEFPVVP